VLLGSIALRALVLGAIGGAVAAAAPLALVLTLAALFTIIATAHKPAQASLLPSLVETPHQLAASNAVWSAVDNGAFLAGAVLSGALIATTSMSAAFLVTAGLFALATVPIALIARDPVPDFRARAEGIRPIEDAVHGFRQVWADRRLRMVVGALAFSTTVEGAIDVLVVLVAINLLNLGGAGVGWLNACWGFGGVIGGAAALTPARDFYVIIDGEAEVFIAGEYVRHLARGDFFGEVAALDWGSGFGYVRTATVVAASDLRLLVLGPDRLGVLIRACPALGAKLKAAARQRMRRM
jgi:Cyclic nucleotide-binding domain